MGGTRVEELREHVQSLHRYALQLTRSRDAAEDLVQECLTRAVAAAGTIEPGLPLRPWLFRILHNVHLDERRRSKVRREHALLGGEETTQATQYDHVELRAVLDAVARLPEDQRAVLHLIAVEGMTYAEAARVLDVPLGTLMSRLARGRDALRRLLQAPATPSLRIVGGRDVP